MTTRKQQSVEVLDTEQEAEVVEAAEAGSTTITTTTTVNNEDMIKRSATKYDDDVNGKSRVFNESTHKFLVYYAVEGSESAGTAARRGSVNGIIVAIFVICLQFGLFSVMWNEGSNGLSYLFNDGGIPVVAALDTCYAYEYREKGGLVESDIFLLNANLSRTAGGMRCAKDPNTVLNQQGSNTYLFSLGTSCILMACFIMEDLLSCVKILLSVPGKWAKFSALLILALNGYAFIAGVYFALAGVLAGSTYDGLVNCVGVLFVHDIDEKLYAALSIIDKSEMRDIKCCESMCKHCKKYIPACCTVCCLWLILIVGMLVAFIIEAAYENNGTFGYTTADFLEIANSFKTDLGDDYDDWYDAYYDENGNYIWDGGYWDGFYGFSSTSSTSSPY